MIRLILALSVVYCRSSGTVRPASPANQRTAPTGMEIPDGVQSQVRAREQSRCEETSKVTPGLREHRVNDRPGLKMEASERAEKEEVNLLEVMTWAQPSDRF